MAHLGNPESEKIVGSSDIIDGSITAPKLNTTVVQTLMPTGAIIYVPFQTAPAGYLKANGSAVSRTTYATLFAALGTTFGAGDGSTTFNLPDLRGEFIRGFDDGRGVDTGRALGTSQADELKSHTHDVPVAAAASGSFGNPFVGPGTSTSGATGGSETRPRNVALLACIKY